MRQRVGTGACGDGTIETDTKSRKLSCHEENDIVQSPCSGTAPIYLAQTRVCICTIKQPESDVRDSCNYQPLMQEQNYAGLLDRCAVPLLISSRYQYDK